MFIDWANKDICNLQFIMTNDWSAEGLKTESSEKMKMFTKHRGHILFKRLKTATDDSVDLFCSIAQN